MHDLNSSFTQLHMVATRLCSAVVPYYSTVCIFHSTENPQGWIA